MKNNPKTHILFFAFILIFAIAFFIPLSLIWSLNTLFKLDILYTWETWLSAAILIVFFGQKVSYSKY